MWVKLNLFLLYNYTKLFLIPFYTYKTHKSDINPIENGYQPTRSRKWTSLHQSRQFLFVSILYFIYFNRKKNHNLHNCFNTTFYIQCSSVLSYEGLKSKMKITQYTIFLVDKYRVPKNQYESGVTV